MSDMLANPHQIPSSRYDSMFSMMNESDGLNFPPDLCKETTTSRVGGALIFDNKIRNYSSLFDGKLLVDRPRYVFFCGQSFSPSDMKRVRRKTFEFIDMISGHVGLTAPKVWILSGQRIIVAEVDRWFLSSSITNHLLLTILRVGSRPYHEHVCTRNPIDFFDNIIQIGRDRVEKGMPVKHDWQHIQKARENGNLDGMLSKTHWTLRVSGFKDDGLDDWRLLRVGSQPQWVGMASWQKENQPGPIREEQKLFFSTASFATTDKLLSGEGWRRTTEDNCLDPKPGYDRWRSSYF